MHSDQLVYRELYDALLNYEGKSPFTDVLAPWTRVQFRECAWLRSFGERRGDPIPSAETEELWRLYALSRICDLLLLRFQTGHADESAWPGVPISLSEYEAFAESLGLVSSRPAAYCPFYHEVVEIEPASDPMQPARVLEHTWPCLMLGDMLFARAGVRVSAGNRVLVQGVADSSTLYWAYRRRNRPYQDLSHGWGGNSQWRTAFRRDYRVGEALYYNVDESRDLAGLAPDDAVGDDLSINERIELLTNRCFVITTKPHDDLWPYKDTLRVEHGRPGA